MDYLRRLAPTPTALRNGRITLVIFAALMAILLILIVLVPDLRDTGMLAITGTTSVALAGDAIAYIGRPTLTRYRLGLVVTTIGVVASFVLLIANPFPPAAQDIDPSLISRAQGQSPP